MIDHFESLRQEVASGLEGKNSGLPMGFKRLSNYISIRKSIFTLVGGYTGSGKTSLIDDAYVLNPMDFVLSDKNIDNLDLEIIYFSMERRKNFKLIKWICRRIFLEQGILIPLNRMMGWVNKSERLTKDEHDLFLMHEDYINNLMTKITIIENPQNPMGIKKYVDDYALKNGKIEKIDEFNSVYIPNNPNKITEIIYDTIGLQKPEKRHGITYNSKKEVIDLSSSDARKFRDFYGFSPIKVSQFNRDISNPMRIKNGDVEPMLEDFKDSGSTQEDADVVLALFDVMRYKVPDPTGYDLDRLRGINGEKMYRSLKILKNSYNSDDVRIGLAFQPVIGHFKELPKLSLINPQDYEDVTSNIYFLKQ